MDLTVAFKHLQHQIEVGCAAQPQMEPWSRGCAASCRLRGPGTVTPGGLVSVSRQEAAAWGKHSPE